MGSRPGPAGERQAFAGGDYLTLYPEGAPHRLRIEAPFPKPGWQARSPGDQLRATHAGTPVLLDGRYYEVVECMVASRGGGAVYYLDPWQEQFALRTPQEYSVEACERLLREHRERLRRRERAHGLRFLGPLVSFLPAPDQLRLEAELNVPAVRNTWTTAAVLWSFSFFVTLAGVATAMAPTPPPGLRWTTPLVPIAGYFAVESAIRFIAAFKMNQPMGSLVVWLPLESWRAVRRALLPQRRRELERRRLERARRSHAFADARDEVRVLEGEEDDLEITSLLAKPHWTANRTAIYVDDVCYYLSERQVQDTSAGPQHRFRLRRADEGMFFSGASTYTPDEVQRVYAEQRRAERGTWVETLAPLLGFLDGERQSRLQEIYGFDPPRYTFWSIVIGLVLGGVAVVSALGHLASAAPGWGDAAVLLGGGLLCWESLLRARDRARGRIRGGVLGILLRPLTRRLLDE